MSAAAASLLITDEQLRALSATQLVDLARRARDARIALARIDVNEFCRLVMRDELTGKPINPAPHHQRWHQIADTSNRAIIWAHIESGKSNQISIGRVLWLLGRDPSMRIAIVSNTHGMAEKIVRSIARHIEQNKMLHQIFPKLRKGTPWTSHSLTVVRDTYSKDPSVQACGVHGNIVGSRLELIVLDDVLDFENTRSGMQRQDLMEWYFATLAGRLTEQGRVLAVGTAYHPDDLYHRFAAMPGWHTVRFPVEDEGGNLNWPERWSRKRIDDKKVELGPMEFARQMLCLARDDSESRFKKQWIEQCKDRGRGKVRMYATADLFFDDHPELEAAWRLGTAHLTTGVDIAVQRRKTSDRTVFFTILTTAKGERYVLNIESARLTGMEIIRKAIDIHERFYSTLIVENNAAQDFIVQFAKELSDVPIVSFTTGKNKSNPEYGVESLAAEFANSKWIIPNIGGNCAKEIVEWITELLYYDPKSHTGDRLMASWFAREGARQHESRRGSLGARII